MAFVKQALRFLSPKRKIRAVLVAVVGSAVLASVLTSDFCLFGCYSRTKCEWTPLEDSLLTVTLPETKRTSGALNLHMWTVGGSVHNFKQSPLFPCFPDRKTFVADATLAIRGCDTGQRMFGFLHPQSSGTFYFAVTSDEASELWLSPDQHPRNASLIAEVQDRNGGVAYTSPEDFMKYPMQMSGGITLNSDQRYFIEVLHKSGKEYAGHVSILWKRPGAETFSVITKQFLLPFCVSNAERCPCVGDVQTPFPSHVQPPPPQPVSEEALQHYYNTPHFDQNHLQDVLTFRLYEPSYVIQNGIVEKHQGIKLVGSSLSSVYPGDTFILNPAPSHVHQGAFIAPNELLPKEHVDALVNQFMEAIRNKHKQ